MNMKKSIAGVMAGALAVSAIATTASAWTGGDADQAQIVLSYDLNKKYEAWSDSTVVLKYNYAPRTDNPYVVEGLTKGGAATVTLGAKLTNYTNYRLTSVNVTGTSTKQSDEKTNTYTKTFSIENLTGTDGKNDVVTIGDWNSLKDNGNVYAYNVPFTANGSNLDSFAMDGFALDQSVTGAKWQIWQKELTEKVSAGTTTYKFVTKLGTGGTGATLATDVPAAASETFDSEADAQAAADIYMANNTDDAAKVLKDTTGNVWYVLASHTNGKSDGNAQPVMIGEYESETAAANVIGAWTTAATTNNANLADTDTPANGNKDEIGYITEMPYIVKVPGVTTNVGYGFNSYDVTMTFSVNKQDWDGVWNMNANWGAVENVSAGITDIKAANFSANMVAGAHGDYYRPMKTNWNEPAEVISRLKDLGYTYPQAVLNDVIANNENVAFTFTTCQHYVDTREYIKIDAINVIKDAGGGKYDVVVTNPIGGMTTYRGVEGLVKNGSTFVKNPYYGVHYDANKKNDFIDLDNALWYHPVFSQDLYQKFTWNGNGYTASGPNGSQGEKDQFGSYASIWNTNLTSAGLVANSMWTMQLSDVDAFEWGDSTITFFWDAITDEANVTNAANFLQTLQLYTPTEWYWDKLDVAVGAAIAEDVSADATLDETPEEVVDEDPDEELIEDTDEDEDEDFGDFEDEDFGDFEDEDEDFTFDEPEDEPEDEPAPAVEEAPAVVEVESPKTGNAPVALAVIPVALAAAAVVAKKRK